MIVNNIDRLKLVSELTYQVCDYFNLKEVGFKSKLKDADLVKARIVFSAILLEKKFNLMQISRYLGRNHTTIIYYRDKCINNKFDILTKELISDFKKVYKYEN